jgi:hypothetical protein
MIGQRKLIDTVRGFSPGRERWADKPVKDLPDKVTVNFSSGQTGFLDMKNPRAVHWARRIDKLQRKNEPVYSEIDDETGVIINIRVPRRFKIERINQDENGNLSVRLKPSSARHLLLRSNPEFETMRASLEAAQAGNLELLITETRDEHEIIDIRKPDVSTGGGPASGPSPIDDPPVSEARATQVFNNMNGQSCSPCSPTSDCIPFLYPDDGCWIRAHIMCHLMRAGGPDPATNPPEDPEKVWIDFAGYPSIPTANHPDCAVNWGWHVAPTLQVNVAGGVEKRVIDPSMTHVPVSITDWRDLQDSTAHLDEGPWTDFNSYGDNNGSSYNLDQSIHHPFLDYCRDELEDRCEDFGPPPYSCNKACFFIVDRSTFSDDEVEAMLHVSAPAVVQNAFYVVVDGFSPYDLGFTAAAMQVTPTLNVVLPSGMTITPVRLEFEYPSHLNRRQRLTWVYEVSFTNTSGFTSPVRVVTMQASLSVVACTGYLYLIQQPNPYEVDGEISWLSTDLRVFQIKQGESKFGANMAADPSTFITTVLSNLNNGSTGGQTFENDISLDQQTSRIELSGTVGGIPVYNFAIAKVRYRSLLSSATDVRVFFRLFPVATTSLEYDQGTTYRRYTSGGTVIPLLGIRNSELVSIPCFAAPRINTAVTSMTAQTDPANVLTMPPDANGAEVVRYFGCWLDINQTQVQFPVQPVGDGPYTSGRQSVQDLIRNEHQCLVSEIAFTPSPAQNGSTPSQSDKLAQRNLAIVQSANPGLLASRRISQTFEIRPSSGKENNDELMFDWGNIPEGAIATLYLPDVVINDILLLSARKYRTHRLLRIDEHTIRFNTGGINYIPIPFTDSNLPGLLTVDLPEGIRKDQVFKVVVHQVTSDKGNVGRAIAEKSSCGIRHIVGSFQVTIPVRDKAEILPAQERLLSNLRWIDRAIPSDNRWAPVFGKYVAQIASRVDALGGNAARVAPSSSGQWKKAYITCILFMLISIVLIALLVTGTGAFAGGIVEIGGIPVIVLLAATVYLWRRKCRPKTCKLLRALLFGSLLGALFLAIWLLIGHSSPRLIATLIASLGVAAIAVVLSWLKGCFK